MQENTRKFKFKIKVLKRKVTLQHSAMCNDTMDGTFRGSF